jgi:hypothetical protein
MYRVFQVVTQINSVRFCVKLISDDSAFGFCGAASTFAKLKL